MEEIWKTLTYGSSIVGILSLVGAGIWRLANWKAQKKVESTKAEFSQAETDKLYDEIRKSNYEWQMRKDADMESFKKEANRKIHGMQRVLTYMLADKREEEFFHCSDIECPKRDPKLGTYKKPIAEWARNVIQEESGIDSDKN